MSQEQREIVTHNRSLGNGKLRYRLGSARQLLSAAEFDQANAVCSGVLSHASLNPLIAGEACSVIAESFWLQRRTGIAARYLRRAIEYSPQRIELYCDLGLVHAWDGHWKAALRAFREAVQLRGKADDWYLLSWAHWMSGDRSAAEESLLVASRNDIPGYEVDMLAMNIFQIGDLDSSLDYARWALTLVPEQRFFKQVLDELLGLVQVLDSVRPGVKYCSDPPLYGAMTRVR